MNRAKKSSKKKVKDSEELVECLLNDYTTIKQSMVMQVRRGNIKKEEFLEDARSYIADYYNAAPETMKESMELFEQHIFGYSRLTPLINDPDISDIRCVSFNKVRVKRRGVRMDSGVRFRSEAEYKGFIDFVATKNQANISNLNAIQRFTDSKSNENFILRFTVAMPLVNTYDEPYLSIRKVPKNFPEMEDLVKKKMLSPELSNELKKRFRDGSTLICGGNSSGKTTILNALKETLPKDKSVLIAQQADELTTKNHPDMMFLHSLPGTGESQVSYDLKDISIAGLTMDVDYFIVGEIKGGEALYLLNAAYTGQICAGTVHAPSADKAIEKIADYSMYEGGYTRDELMKMLSCFRTVVFMKEYKVNQVYEVTGWNPDTKDIEYRAIYEREE